MYVPLSICIEIHGKSIEIQGTHGGMQIEVDSRGHQVGILGIREPIKGRDLYLSIDIRLQEFIEKIF